MQVCMGLNTSQKSIRFEISIVVVNRFSWLQQSTRYFSPFVISFVRLGTLRQAFNIFSCLVSSRHFIYFKWSVLLYFYISHEETSAVFSSCKLHLIPLMPNSSLNTLTAWCTCTQTNIQWCIFASFFSSLHMSSVFMTHVSLL